MRETPIARPTRARSGSAILSRLLDALGGVLLAPRPCEEILRAAAPILASELDCLCMTESLVRDTASIVGLAHADRALDGRLDAALGSTLIRSSPSSASWERGLRSGRPFGGEAADVQRHGLGDVERLVGRRLWSFCAVPLVARGERHGMLWVVSTRRARVFRSFEQDGLFRVAPVIALSLAAASAAEPLTGTRRCIAEG